MQKYSSSVFMATPLLGVVIMQLLGLFNLLTYQSIVYTIIIVAVITTSFVVLNELDSAFFDWLIMVFLWIALFPFYILRKFKEGQKGYHPLIISAIIFLLVVGSMEMIRLGFSKVSDNDSAKVASDILGLALYLVLLILPTFLSLSRGSTNTILVSAVSGFSLIAMPFLGYVIGSSIAGGLILISAIVLLSYFFAVFKSLKLN